MRQPAMMRSLQYLKRRQSSLVVEGVENLHCGSHTPGAVVSIVAVLMLCGCGFFPEKVGMDDPRIQPLLKAAASFDRTSYGFTPIPKTAEVRLESRPTNRYDAMIHISSKTSRTIAFRIKGGSYRWIGDQEIFEGPKEYKTVDGTFHEHICLTYEIESVSGYPTNRLNIAYFGEDPRMADRRALTLEEIRPVLTEWGY